MLNLLLSLHRQFLGLVPLFFRAKVHVTWYVMIVQCIKANLENGGLPGVQRYTWCNPPVAYPSQINLLAVNSTAIVVNFITADEGARSACPVEAELKNVATDVVTRYQKGWVKSRFCLLFCVDYDFSPTHTPLYAHSLG